MARTAGSWLALAFACSAAACSATESDRPAAPAPAPTSQPGAPQPGAPPVDERVAAGSSSEDWRVWAARLDSPRSGADSRRSVARERFVRATELFLDTPYENGPLGEGAGGDLDSDPRVDFSRADCVTFLEQTLALALLEESADADFLALLDAIRYREGNVSYADRNHYMVADWIPSNAWLLEDVTVAAGGEHTVPVRRTIDRSSFLRDHGAKPRRGRDDPREIEVRIIPSESLADVAGAIESGDLVFWVGKRDGIFVVHTGLAVRAGSELIFRHASSKAGRALDEPFADYAARASFAAGFLLLRLRDEPWPPPGMPDATPGDAASDVSPKAAG